MEKGFDWIIMVSVFFISLNHGGAIFTTGKFYIYFKNAFKKSESETALVSALYATSEYCFAPFASLISNKFGHRTTVMLGSVLCATGIFLSAFAPNLISVYFTAGILAGCGMSMAYTQSLPVLSFYFEKYRAFATGIVLAGAAIGIVIYSYLIDFFVEELGWRGTFIIVAGIVLNCTICGALLKPNPKRKFENREKIFDITIFKDVNCLLFVLANMLWTLMISMPWIIIPVHTLGCDAAKNALPLAGVSSIFGRLVFSALGSHKFINPMLFVAFITFLNGFPLLGITLSCDAGAILLLTCVLGFCMGYQYTAGTYLATDVFGVERVTIGFGVLMCGEGIVWLCGPPLAGLIHHTTGSYTGASIVGIVTSTLAALLYAYLWKTKRNKGQKELKTVHVLNLEEETLFQEKK